MIKQTIDIYSTTRSLQHEIYNQADRAPCPSTHARDAELSSLYTTAYGLLMLTHTHTHTHTNTHIHNLTKTDTCTHIHKHTSARRHKQNIHQRNQICLPSRLWILLFTLLISMLPNSCRSACANAIHIPKICQPHILVIYR